MHRALGTAVVLMLIAIVYLLAARTAWAAHHLCSNFSNQAAAQAHYRADPAGRDHGAAGHSALDPDGNGIACESLPGPFDRMSIRAPAAPPPAAPAAAPARPAAMPRAGAGIQAEAGTTAGWALTGLAVAAVLLVGAGLTVHRRH